MENLLSLIRQSARVYHSEMIAIRRHLHAHPEPSMAEYKTAEFISDLLKKWEIPFRSGIANTGIVAIVEGFHPGKTIALRADMDALPIKEENSISFASQNPGWMHACGHDVHMAILLSVAHILQENRSKLAGRFVLIFQPSEESFPGGAIQMIEQGVLENPVPSAIFALHVSPEMECGTVGAKAGKYMASTDEIYLTVTGKGGHGATPDQNIDPVVAACGMVLQLQQVVSRLAPPDIPTVLSFGKMIANGRTNIIPDTVEIAGTLRTFNEDWRAKALQHIQRIAKAHTQAVGADCEVKIAQGYPFLVNNEQVVKRFFSTASMALKPEKVLELPLRMTSEDFAYFAQKIPACFFRLGVANKEKGILANLHSSRFDVDEKSLEIGTLVMLSVALSEAGNDLNVTIH